MYLKILAVLVCMVVAYCQDHQHRHSFSLKTVVTHEVPKKLEYHHYEPKHISAPIQKQVIQEYHALPEIQGNALPPQSLVHPTIQKKAESFYQEAPERAFLTPHEPAPVYESVEPVRAPVKLKIIQQGAPHAPTHRVVQLVQQIPIKPPVIRVASVTPVTHPAPIVPIVPILHQAAIAPIIQQAPVQHPIINVVQQAPVQHRIIQEIHRTPIQQFVVQETLRAPIQQHVVQETLRAPIQQYIVEETLRAPIQQHVVQETLRVPIEKHVVQETLRTPIQQQVVQETHRTPIQQYVVQETPQAPIQQHVVEVVHAPLPHHEETYNTDTYKIESHHEEPSDQESHHEIDYYAHPKYEYAYEVKDPHTHDEKYHHESRDGDVVNGVYSLHEPDGSVRTVKYSSDKKTGFNAEVSHIGHTEHIIPHHHHH